MKGAPADVDAVVVEPTRALRWELVSLERYLAASADPRITMFKHLSRDFAGKLGSYPRGDDFEATSSCSLIQELGPTQSADLGWK